MFCHSTKLQRPGGAQDSKQVQLSVQRRGRAFGSSNLTVTYGYRNALQRSSTCHLRRSRLGKEACQDQTSSPSPSSPANASPLPYEP